MAKLFRFVILGGIAGAVGTLCMDLVWYRRFRSGGGTQPFLAWETSEGLQGYENAPAPAQTAKVAADFIGVQLPDSTARAANNAVHWLTGIGWGKFHGAISAMVGTTSPVFGLVSAVVAWATSYVVLPRLGVYKPMSEYDTEVLWQDLSAHLSFGAGLGLTFRLLAGKTKTAT